jgi:hypothetical protein
MRPIRLSLDTKKLEQPKDTYPYGKNGVRSTFGATDENESGFLPSGINIPYKVNGIIETDTYPIYFSTDNVNSAFGYHDIDKDIYVPIFNDSALSFKLNFNINHPIKGEYRRNFRNEIELTWLELDAETDTKRNPPRWANTVRIGTNLNDFLLFPKSLIPYIDTTLQPGGNLGMGAYYFGVKYIKSDGTETRYTTLTRPLIAFSDNYDTIPGTNTGKAIQINITGLDTTYDRIGLVVVARINGVDTPYELPELSIASTISFLYTGSEKLTQLTIEEVLIPAAYYENAVAITQLSDQLFLANMEEEAIIDWQKYASMVTLRWKSELVNIASRPILATESGKQRGWMHEEVGAFYCVLKLRSGRNSRAFTIPGPKALSGDLITSAIGTAQGLTAPVYALEDTCRNIVGTTGDFGVWINLDETYPDITQFDSTAVGGENLRGQPVRHHRFPSIYFCKQNIYAANPDYGRASLDTLGLMATNVIIPTELQDKVIGWEIHYAKKDFNTALVAGQSLLMFGAQANENTGSDVGITSTAGNWNSYQRTRGSGSVNDNESLKVNVKHARFHAFDLLYFRPSISPNYLSLQLREVIHIDNNAIAVNNANEQIYSLDYLNGANNVDAPAIPAAKVLRIDRGQYITNNANSGDFNNIRLEDAYVMHIPQQVTPINNLTWGWAKRDYTNGNNNTPSTELTYLANLMTIRRNVYQSYYSQELVRTGQVFSSALQASDTIIYGGDCFIGRHSFTTYGLVTKKDVVSNTGIRDWKTGDTDGIKAVHFFICEMVADAACRYETPGDTYSKFAPKSTLSTGINSFLYTFSRNNNPNQIGYSKDCNAVGNLLNGITIASPYDQFVSLSPTKIVRSQKQISESVINSWKNFNALDYYETVKNKGEITNLCSMNDRLIIHHKNGIFITRSKTTLNSDILEVTLGAGDIFQFEPNEVRPAKLGYGGTTNPLACLLTPVGYMYPDNITGEIFLFNGSALANIGTGLINFLLKYLTVKEINSYLGNGISIGYEQVYKRLLLTVKNTSLNTGALVFVPNYVATSAFFATLTANVSVVYKDGRYQLFKGLNTSIYACNTQQYPVLPNYNFSSNEHVANGTVIGTIVATGGLAPYSYLITTVDKAGLIVNPLTGVITVQDSSLFDYTRSVLSLTTLVTDANGNTDPGIVNVTIIQVASVPTMPSYSINLNEHSANGTAVQTVHATDRDGKSITYSITAGNGLGGFTINSSTGAITVANQAILDYPTTPVFNLTVRATASDASYVENTVSIYLVYVFQAPTATNSVFSIADTLATGSVVGTATAATQRAGQSGSLIYELVTDSTPPGAFQVIIDPLSADFLKVEVLNNSLLDPINNNYIVTIRVYNELYLGTIVTFTVTITVYYDPALLSGEGYAYTCIY